MIALDALRLSSHLIVIDTLSRYFSCFRDLKVSFSYPKIQNNWWNPDSSPILTGFKAHLVLPPEAAVNKELFILGNQGRLPGKRP